MVKPIEGRLKLLRTHGNYWKAVVEHMDRRRYYGSVLAELVEKPAKQIIRFLAEKHEVEIFHFESRGLNRQ